MVPKESAKGTPIDSRPEEMIPSHHPSPNSTASGMTSRAVRTEINEILINFDKGANITGLRGMGGIGKTALALVLADRIKGRFPDGDLYLDLRGTSKSPLSPAEAMAQVIRAYRPTDKMPEDQNEVRGLYLSVLSGKKTEYCWTTPSTGTRSSRCYPLKSAPS